MLEINCNNKYAVEIEYWYQQENVRLKAKLAKTVEQRNELINLYYSVTGSIKEHTKKYDKEIGEL